MGAKSIKTKTKYQQFIKQKKKFSQIEKKQDRKEKICGKISDQLVGTKNEKTRKSFKTSEAGGKNPVVQSSPQLKKPRRSNKISLSR